MRKKQAGDNERARVRAFNKGDRTRGEVRRVVMRTNAKGGAKKHWTNKQH
ncbi:hypothetical protein ACFPCW_13890 [Vibrio thalassae]